MKASTAKQIMLALGYTQLQTEQMIGRGKDVEVSDDLVINLTSMKVDEAQRKHDSQLAQIREYVDMVISNQ